MTRRDLIRSVGLGTCAVAAAWLSARAHGLLDDRPAPLSVADLVPSDLGPYARRARYFRAMSGQSDCTACHSGVEEPSRIGFCHTQHDPLMVRCDLCPRGCVIANGHRGHCEVRENRAGTLYTLVYGNPCTANVDPIEKKPLFHFLPATMAFSIATAGCNLDCLYCQNWQISQARPEDVAVMPASPDEVAASAAANGCPSVAFTYAEPTICFEYMVDTAAAARAAGIKTVVVSAGYISAEPLAELCKVVDAIKIDLKGYSPAFYRKICNGELEPVLRTIESIHRSGVHLEIVNLVVPTMNDASGDLRALVEWVVRSVGPDVPLHFSRFHPDYKLADLPDTPLQKMDEAYEAAKRAGCHYPYVGNVPGHPGNNTYCPRCQRLVIGREGFWVTSYELSAGACRFCGQAIPGVWGPVS